MHSTRVFLLAGLAWLAGISGAAAQSAPFAEVGTAFLETHCVSCHGKDKQKGGVTLHQMRDETSVLRSRKQWKKILNLVQSGEMPPDDKPQPSAEEKKRFLESVMTVFAKADNAKPDPGRVTVRRLNRTEYNNTVRDLLKVDFRPADDFPSDDVGYGFDNIADVLSVSPVLMERYLEAAERIAEQAIPITAARPPKRTMAGKFCEPASTNVPQDQFRPINADQKDLVFSGPLHTPARIEPGNDYFVRARLFAKSANGAPVRVALLATGEKLPKPASAAEQALLDGGAINALKPFIILQTADITARDASQAQTLEVRLKPPPGIEKIAIAAYKPPKGQPPPTLYVEFLEQEGPLDTTSPSTKALMVFTPGRPERDQVREVLWRFVAKAWRRPVEVEELDRLCAMVDYAVGHNEGWEGGLRRAITAVLSSPKFIFRLEPDDQPANPEPHPITEFQLAARLSYFLWSSCPDDQLLQLAYEKKLSANLEGQVRRMLEDPRSSALVDNFAVQWLQLGRLASHAADGQTFPAWKPELKASMLEETKRFCREILRQDRSILDLLDADFTWVDRRLAELYRITPPGGLKGDEWKRVSLNGTNRGGLLTQASILTVTSNPTRTSPVKRGKWVLEQLLGAPPPPAPPNIPSLDDSQRKELTGTFRQKLEQHRADPNCAGCHTKMDAFGFTLESFDGIGQWRDRDETGQPVNANAELGSDHPLEGVAGLKQYLKEHRHEFARCFTEKMLIYALGRGLDYYDDPAVDRIQAALARNEYRFTTLLTEIVKSDPFRLRRGTSQQPATTAQR